MRMRFRLLAVLLVVALSPTSFSAGPQSDLQPGLVWVRFNGADFTRPWCTGMDAQVDLDTGTSIADFSQIWRGWIRSDRSGQAAFLLEADDEAKISVDGRPLRIDGAAEEPWSEKVSFEAQQPVPVTLRFVQRGGWARFRLFWQCQGGAKELVPAAILWHDSRDLEEVTGMAKGEIRPDIRREVKSSIYDPTAPYPEGSRAPLPLGPGPHLLLDQRWVRDPVNLTRTVNRPVRDLEGPVVSGRTGQGDNCFQPYLTVLRDADTGRFRIWYGVPENEGQSHVGTMESEDGIHWIRPHQVLEDPSPIQFGVSILDSGLGCADATARYKYGYYGSRDDGLRVAVSGDGLHWRPLTDRAVISHNHDINSIHWDPIRGRYMALVSAYTTGETWSGNRRVSMESVSSDLVHWEDPWFVITPKDGSDQGETQFYCMDGILPRGEALVGMIKVLRDDLPADVGGQKAGIGATCLGWSWDGVSWIRDQEPFFDRDATPGAWDHAMAWIDEQVGVGDEVFLYYGGYAKGHKINRFEERQIGLVRLPKDRYVAWGAGEEEGRFRTGLVEWRGRQLLLNVDARGGQVCVQMCDDQGRPKKGFAFRDCEPITGDGVALPVRWKKDVSELEGAAVRIEFSMKRSRIFAFDQQG